MINHILFLPPQQQTSRFERFYDLQTATLYTYQPAYNKPTSAEVQPSQLIIQSASGVKDNVILLHANAADALRGYLHSIAMPINVEGNSIFDKQTEPQPKDYAPWS